MPRHRLERRKACDADWAFPFSTRLKCTRAHDGSGLRHVGTTQELPWRALVGVVVVAAFASTLMLTIMLRIREGPLALALVAFLCIAGTQVVFWIYTLSANQETNNWTVLPENWRALRAQWESSHAASAAMNLAALTALILGPAQGPVDEIDVVEGVVARGRERGTLMHSLRRGLVAMLAAGALTTGLR